MSFQLYDLKSHYQFPLHIRFFTFLRAQFILDASDSPLWTSTLLKYTCNSRIWWGVIFFFSFVFIISDTIIAAFLPPWNQPNNHKVFPLEWGSRQWFIFPVTSTSFVLFRIDKVSAIKVELSFCFFSLLVTAYLPTITYLCFSFVSIGAYTSSMLFRYP